MTRLWTDDEWRAALSTAAINDLPDSAFAYIAPGGTTDESGKTAPRNLRHYPVHDKAHADNALARADALIADDQADHDDREIAEKALPAIKAAVKKFADATEVKAARWAAEHRDDEITYGALEDMLEAAITDKFSVGWADWYCWVVDFTSTWVVYSVQGQKFQVDYALDGTTVTIADAPVMVVEEPNYVPMQVNSGRVANNVRPKKPRHRSQLPNGLEVRHFVTEGIELRDDGSNTVHLVGRPIIYDTDYFVRDIFGQFTERMVPGVATDLLASGSLDCRFLFNHGGLPLGRTTSGTLSLSDTPAYLESDVALDVRQQLAADLMIAIQRGDCNQMSVGMVVGQDQWDARQENRTILKLKDLQDVSAVTYPASPTTNIEVAQRMLMEMPVESRDRVRRFWSMARDLREGWQVDPEAMDVLSDGLRALAVAEDLTGEAPAERAEPEVGSEEAEVDRTSSLIEAVSFIETARRAAGSTPKWAHLADLRSTLIDVLTELRATPTPQDAGIATKIKAAHQAVADAIHAQMDDTDNASDPVDAAVMDALQGAHKALGKATVAQSIDGAPDALRCAACQRDNTPDSLYCAGCGAPLAAPGTLGGDDSTLGNPAGGTTVGNAEDGSGLRKRMTTAELRRQDELARIERSKRSAA